MSQVLPATLFTVFTAVVIIFQGCLAAGVPWGKASMGGRYPGRYPPAMRIVAIINMIVMGFIIAIVLSKAELMFPRLRTISETGIWFVVGFFGIGTVLNTITPSKVERIWAPVALVQLITSAMVATG